MKTTKKILRGVTTSLLFIILAVTILVNLIFTSLRLTASSLPGMINRESLLAEVYDEEIQNSEIKEVAINYINDYINYVFHKRSFPSIQTVDYGEMSGGNLEQAQQTVKEISDNLSLEYEPVLNFRKINGITSNGAIYLIINVGLFLVLVIVFILNRPPLRSLTFSLWAFLTSGLVFLISIPIVLSKLKTSLSSIDYTFLMAILNQKFTLKYRLISILCILIPLVILILIYLVKKVLLPHFRHQH